MPDDRCPDYPEDLPIIHWDSRSENEPDYVCLQCGEDLDDCECESPEPEVRN